MNSVHTVRCIRVMYDKTRSELALRSHFDLLLAR